MRSRRALALVAVAALVIVAPATNAGPATARDPGAPRTVETASPGVEFELPAVAVDCRGDGPGTEIDPEQLRPAASEPVLLVHGTFTRGDENYRWALAEHLASRGLRACWFDYAARGFADQQRSGEITAAAMLRLADATVRHPSGGRIDVLGHSQGAVLPRWAVRWFPAARAVVDDMVLLAGPARGTRVTAGYGLVPGAGCDRALGACFESAWQFSPESNFVEALNRAGETFASIDYTSIYTLFDELVRHGVATGDPRREVEDASALIDADGDPANVRNLLMQDLCPGRPADHLSVFADAVMAEIAVAAFTSTGPGPATVAPEACVSATFADVSALTMLTVAGESLAGGTTSWPRATAEPPLRTYARP